MIKRLLNLYDALRCRLTLLQMRGKADLGADVKFGRNFYFKCPKSKKNQSFSVGSHVLLEGMWVVQGEGRIRVGDYCSFRSGTYVGAVQSITIGNNVFGAENVFIVDNNNHPTCPQERFEMTMEPPNGAKWKWARNGVERGAVVIEDNVWIGRNSMILKGVKIGTGSIVAAGAVVVKSVPAYSIVAGNPARVVKSLVDSY